ncbi:MAG: beta-galactosidase [Lacunisphaera sp.]|nr:beta-galactosidase [Lacunisphaera sp.]
MPYIVGGQIVVQWKAVEPESGRYDFASIAEGLKKLRMLGKKATIQINGNEKPTWLFSAVPYYPEKLSVQVRDQKGTLMYWHPLHRAAYTNMLKAFADFLAQSPDRDALIGIRLNFNAIGTEHFPVAKEAQDPTKWIVPPGASPGPPWSREQVTVYEQEVVDTFVDYLSPHAKIFVRNNINAEIAKQYRSSFENGKLGWFHTSSEAEPRGRELEGQYRRFYDDCRSGKTVGYAEPWASAWGDHGKTDHRSCSPPQWNYWRTLLDLHCGVSFLALYANDLAVAVTGRYDVNRNQYDEKTDRRGYQQEFEAAFRFAAKYVGFHASPEISPGAWVAFRENPVALATNVPSESERRLSFFNGDYNFLMERMPDQTAGVHNIGPDNQRQGAWARVLPPAEKLELKLDARFAASFQGGKVRVTYLDQAGDIASPFQLIANEKQLTVKPQGTGRWETAELELPDGPLRADPAGAHVRIVAGSKPVCLHMLEVSRR